MSNGFPTFYEWITSDDTRKSDYEYAAVNYAGHFGMTGDASNIIRDHADSLAHAFSHNTDPEDVTEREAEDFADSCQYETYSGPTRAALIHWAWNSDMDLNEFGPLRGDNIWTQIEHITWHQIDRATQNALGEYAEQYAEARDEWEDEDEDED